MGWGEFLYAIVSLRGRLCLLVRTVQGGVGRSRRTNREDTSLCAKRSPELSFLYNSCTRAIGSRNDFGPPGINQAGLVFALVAGAGLEPATSGL